MTLPTEKNQPGQNPLLKKMLLYAEPKVGKSTLVSKLFPNAVFFATDPTGLEELEVFKVDIADWMTFRRAAGELAEYLAGPAGDIYDAICVDTVDELSRLCSEHVLADLSGGPVKGFKHVSDWEYGKGYDAITEEFRLRIAKLCALGLPVVFISHSKTKTKKNRTGLEITIQTPDIGKGQLRDWLTKFVDYIFYAEIIQTDGGETRVLRTTPSESYLAGARQPEGRVALPETLPLDGDRLRAALLATIAPGANVTASSSAEGNTAEVDVNLRDGSVEVKPNGRKKAEPKKVQDARKVVAAIDEKIVAEDGYLPKEAAALRVIAEYEAKQRTPA